MGSLAARESLKAIGRALDKPSSSIYFQLAPHGGFIFLIAALVGAGLAHLWFQIFGLFYAGMAAWGFLVGDGMICGVILNNNFDSWGHAGLAVILLLAGFAIPKRTSMATKAPSPQRMG